MKEHLSSDYSSLDWGRLLIDQGSLLGGGAPGGGKSKEGHRKQREEQHRHRDEDQLLCPETCRAFGGSCGLKRGWR